MRRTSTILGALILVALITAVYFFSQVQPGYVFRVYIDSLDVGTLDSMDEYRAILAETLRMAADEMEMDLELGFAQQIKAVREFQWQPESTPGAVRRAIQQKAQFITMGWAIMVQSEPMVYLSSEEQAQLVLDQVALYYAGGANRELVEAEIVDEVTVEPRQVAPEVIVDLNTAVNYLVQGRERVETYTVSRGESLWSISRSMNISQEELKKANPQLQSTSVLRPGDTLNLVMAEPKINIRTVERVKANEAIPFQTTYRSTGSLWYYQQRVAQQGVPGQRQITYLVEYINGIEVGREVVDTKVVSEPVTRIIEQGTSRWPSGSAGMFRWPINTGQITDRFGAFQSWRTQRHSGVDIGAPSGTPIYAAAAGTVIQAGYMGSYGNTVIIDHGNGYATLYAHASTLLVSSGQRVSQGQMIARVGSTGFSTGPHLHFEVRRNGNPVDPLGFYRP